MCVWQGTLGLTSGTLASAGPGRPPLFAPCVWRKGLQPGGLQSLTVMDGPGAPGYCQGVGSRCPSGLTESGTGFQGRRRELRAAAGQGSSLQNLQFPWHFYKGPHASDLAGVLLEDRVCWRVRRPRPLPCLQPGVGTALQETGCFRALSAAA